MSYIFFIVEIVLIFFIVHSIISWNIKNIKINSWYKYIFWYCFYCSLWRCCCFFKCNDKNQQPNVELLACWRVALKNDFEYFTLLDTAVFFGQNPFEEYLVHYIADPMYHIGSNTAPICLFHPFLHSPIAILYPIFQFHNKECFRVRERGSPSPSASMHQASLYGTPKARSLPYQQPEMKASIFVNNLFSLTRRASRRPEYPFESTSDITSQG